MLSLSHLPHRGTFAIQFVDASKPRYSCAPWTGHVPRSCWGDRYGWKVVPCSGQNEEHLFTTWVSQLLFKKNSFLLKLGMVSLDFQACKYSKFGGLHQNRGWRFPKSHIWQWQILVVKMGMRNWGASSKPVMWRLSFGGLPKNPKRVLTGTEMLLGWYFCRSYWV